MTDRERILCEAILALATGEKADIAYTKEGDEYIVIGRVTIQTRTGQQRDPDLDRDADIPKNILALEIE